MIVRGGRGLQSPADHVFVHLDESDDMLRPVLMFGQLARQDPSGRVEPPPECISGFDTGGTPFAKGHIMAVELGGWDDSNNIVPQYEKWQALATGDWRAMETAIHQAHAVQSMIVRMTYAAVPNAYQAQRTLFNSPDGSRLFHWTDPRIPTRFEVWASHSANPGGYFSLSGEQKLAQSAIIIGALGAASYDFTIDSMPQVDRDYWRALTMRSFVDDEYNEYRVNREVQMLTHTALAVRAQEQQSGVGKRKTKRQISGEYDRAHPELKKDKWLTGLTADRLAKAVRDNEGGAFDDWTEGERAHFQGAHLAHMVFGA